MRNKYEKTVSFSSKSYSSHSLQEPLQIKHPVPLSKRQMNRIKNVNVHLMFLRLGEIDTLNEKYQAHASIEARWSVKFDKLSANLSPDDQKRLVEGKSVSLLKYAESHWHPQLYIENAVGDLKEQIRYSAKKFKEDDEFYVCEHRDVKGSFWEKLELYHFPSDVQDLSISVASMFYDDKVVLQADPSYLSGMNREAFSDQQEWSLYPHVDAQQRYVKEFLFQDNDKNDEDEDEEENTKPSEDRRRSIVTVTCHAARRSSYFYWNGYCLILLINLSSFCIFAIPPNLAANRIQISCTLLLASITFRWTVNRTLPTISYLTSLDKYAILCMFILVIQCIWHGIIGATIFINTPDNRVTPSMTMVHIDQYVFFVIIGLFIAKHILLIAWLYLSPLKHRKNMEKRGIDYERSQSIKKADQRKSSGKIKSDQPPTFSRIPVES